MNNNDLRGSSAYQAEALVAVGEQELLHVSALLPHFSHLPKAILDSEFYFCGLI